MKLILVLSLAATLLLIPSPAAACSCAIGTRAEHLRSADAVFTGTVLEKRDPQGGGPLISSARPIYTTFVVEEVRKGDLEVTVTVVTAASGASCGFHFQRGRRYEVFADQRRDVLDTGLCSGTSDVRGAAGVALGETVAVAYGSLT